jgi:hypothetical protein
MLSGKDHVRVPGLPAFNSFNTRQCSMDASISPPVPNAMSDRPRLRGPCTGIAGGEEGHAKATKQPLFDTGQLVATLGALAALEKAGQSAIEFLSRHVCGDWGELPNEDKAENHFTLEKGFRLLSSFRTAAGDKLWVITEADRSVTTILLPEEY